ncbi:MAG: sulfatase-like hydrolase/transferase [Opitutales bacterium]|nr:sulfatase-like hydrolase/transferase [Opitutales bacterium]
MKRMISFVPLLAFFLCLTALANERPNVVIILADDMGYCDVGVYGCEDIETVNIDRLAAEGVRFTSGYSSHPYCSPMRAALMAGRYQHRFGYERNIAYDQHNEVMGLPQSEETVASRMQKAGYTTGGIGKWHLGAAAPFQPNSRGFDFFYGFRGGGHRYFDVDLNTRLREGYYAALERNGQPEPLDGYLTTALTDEAIGFIESNQDKPFFLYLAYNAPHGPLEAPDKIETMYQGIEDVKRRTYAAMVHALDDEVGRVVDTLNNLGLRKNTIVYFLSDNGGPEHANSSENGLLRGGKGEVYEGGIRVPFIVSWPGRIPKGSVNDSPVMSIDVMRTSLELAGAPIDAKLEGVNLMPYLDGSNASDPHEALFWRMENGKDYAVRSGPWKMTKARDQKGVQLYNVEEDIGESRDLASLRPEVMSRLTALYGSWNAKNIAPFFPGYRDYHARMKEVYASISAPVLEDEDAIVPNHLVELAWAYAIDIEKPPPLEDHGGKYSLPDTPLTFDRNQILGRDPETKQLSASPADWYPGDHPPMPDVVAHGAFDRNVIACALCHYPNGKGKAENANPAGMPKEYLVQQLLDMQNDVRKSAEPRKKNYQTMIDIAKGMTPEEIEASAEYFASMPWSRWIDVRETKTVPKTYFRGGLHIPHEGVKAGMEPIGKRIVETPVDPLGTELMRNPRAGFIAYVPEGSIAKGEALVRSGGGKTLQCAICHGEHLNGIGTVPGIASRSPSYMARQLNDIKQGTRAGTMAALMKPVVENLTSEDILNIVAYTASLQVPESEN